MAIRREKPKPHVVIVDTNALWHEQKKHAAAPEFDTAWNENAKLVTLELVVPEIVRHELAFQQTTAAWNRLDQIVKLMAEVSEISDSSHSTRITREKIHSQVEAKIDRWIRSRRAAVLPVPYATVDWQRVSMDAVWRRPPFSFDPKKSDVEKGFRDALILETVLDVVHRETRDVNIVFISGDYLLRKAAVDRLRTDTRFSAYENVSGFSSYVRLTREQLDNEFIRSIVDRAREKFLTPDDATSLYLREKIADKIADQFTDYFADPEKSDKSPFKLPSSGAPRVWEPVAPGRWWIAGDEFVSLEPERIYHWRTRLGFARGYRRRDSPLYPAVYLPSVAPTWDERLLFLQFDVFWKAFVKADARFYNVELERLELSENAFRVPHGEERAYVGFDLAESGLTRR